VAVPVNGLASYTLTRTLPSNVLGLPPEDLYTPTKRAHYRRLPRCLIKERYSGTLVRMLASYQEHTFDCFAGLLLCELLLSGF
jgi:hypothetical protein